MTQYRGRWSEDEVETFLAETVVPIRLATTRPDGSRWIVALWYRHRDGVIECATQASADLVRFLDHDESVAFDVSTNRMPYRGIRGSGIADVSPDPEKAVLGDLLERYLGGTESALAESLLDEGRDEVRIRIDPRTIYSWDFADRMGDIDEERGE